MFETRALSLLAAWVALILLAQTGYECANKQNLILDYVIHHPALHQQVREALLALKLPQDATPERIVEEISLKSEGNGPSHHIYRSLAGLSRGDWCPHHAVICCISIMTQEELIPFRKFVELYKEKFYKCVERDINHNIGWYMTNLKLSPDLLSSFETFMRGAMGYDGEGEYLERLEKFDLLESKLNVERMLEEADKHNLLVVEEQVSTLPASTQIERFLDSRCFPFYVILRSEFGVINLAALLQHHPPYNEYVLTMNEYNRICIAWFKKSSRIKVLKRIWALAPQHAPPVESSAENLEKTPFKRPNTSTRWLRRLFKRRTPRNSDSESSPRAPPSVPLFRQHMYLPKIPFT